MVPEISGNDIGEAILLSRLRDCYLLIISARKRPFHLRIESIPWKKVAETEIQENYLQN